MKIASVSSILLVIFSVPTMTMVQASGGVRGHSAVRRDLKKSKKDSTKKSEKKGSGKKGGKKGSDDEVVVETIYPTASPTPQKLGTPEDSYENLQGCVTLHNEASHEKYFWIMLINPNNKNDSKTKGICLLDIPKNKGDGKTVCCTFGGEGATTPYNSNWDISVLDPYAVTPCMGNGALYDACGPLGGSSCPDYKFEKNHQAFKNFQIQKHNGNTLSQMGLFVHANTNHQHYKCGLKDNDEENPCQACDEYGICQDVNQFQHAAVGTGDCLEAMVTISTSSYCHQSNGWQCQMDDCSGNTTPFPSIKPSSCPTPSPN